jgi:quinoprotein glucose dehydrogenase
MRRFLAVLGTTICCGLFVGLAWLHVPAAEKDDKPYTPKVEAASNEAEQAIKRFRLPSGVKANVFAAEPMLANPVAFCFDDKGRCYVAETFRLKDGVTDNREHMYWLDDDLACRTVEDRVALYKKWLKDKFPQWEVEHERIRLIEDTDGDGVADKATVFADGFHHAADGLGAGVMARKGTVYYTCIPDVWALRDTKGTGKADEKKSLSHGYGVHVAFLGHDLHGLRMGPDCRLYFSSGDRGLNVKTKEGGVIFNPDCGAVLRCEPDGSNLELVATGLRNPQKLAFDDHGNLFTCDNNSDSGDKARLAYIVEGGDSGWRMPYQYDSAALGSRGPFNYEKLWHLPHEGQPAYIVPPLAHISDGPSGFCFNYGATGLPERYGKHFFLCDFRGDAGISGVRSFAVKPKGASFEMVDQHEFIWGILATDCEFGPDGAFYISDWVHGWDKTGKGRIYRFQDADALKKNGAAEVKKLLADGFDKRAKEELVKLLEHPDLRVRQEAQFALADEKAVPELEGAAKNSKNQLARLHGLWGLGQIARTGATAAKGKAATTALAALLGDSDSELRGQAAQALGDAHASVEDKVIPLLKDAEPRVRFFAALTLSKVGSTKTIEPVLDMLRENADKDAYLRHAGVMAMTRIGERDSLQGRETPEGNEVRKAVLSASRDDSAAVRMAVLLTLRRWQNAEIARFLEDSDARLVDEAARAIYDEPIIDAVPVLAKLIKRDKLSDATRYRVINANLHLGKISNAEAVAEFAARAGAPEALRLEAMHVLGDWAKPAGRDRVLGFWRPLDEQPQEIAADALRPKLAGIMSGPDQVRREGVKVAAKFGIKEVGPFLLETLADKKSPSGTRIETLRALEALKDERLEKGIKLALEDDDPRLRNEGRRALAKRQPAEAISSLEKALEKGSLVEQQGAFAVLGDIKDRAAATLLSRWMDTLLAKQVPPEAQLDLLDAAAKHSAADLKDKLAKFEAARPKDDHLAKYRESLVGGDAENGRRIFFNKQDAQCLKCHKVSGVGGEVGPELKGIGSRQNREYLLESIVDPNKQIAKGYETVVITTKKGKVVTGILKSEDAAEVKLMTPEGNLVVISKDQIDERRSGKSAMPEDLLKYLSKAEIRDLVEFLAGLKEQ